MTRNQKVLAALGGTVLAATVVLAVTGASGSWLTIGGPVASIIGLVIVWLGLRSDRRAEDARQAAFAERIRLIREGKLKPGDPSR